MVAKVLFKEVMAALNMLQLMQAMSSLPLIMETVKNMGEEEKEEFLGQLGLEGAQKKDAHTILTAFQEGETLGPEEQTKAQALLEKALQMNMLDLETLLSLANNSGVPK